MYSVVLTTGGTGGHVFPALAIAEELRLRTPDIKLLFLGSCGGAEEKLVRQAGIAFEGLPVRGLMGRGIKAVGAALRMAGAVGTAVRILKNFQPQIVVGFGGYAAVAPMVAAYFLGIPGVLHEQNAIAGTGNRLLAKFARQVCLSLPQTEGFPQEKCTLTGNPVRAAINVVGLCERQWATRHLLVTGGSQGAHTINMFMLEHLQDFRDAGFEIRHQTGVAEEEKIRTAYVAAGYAPECVSAFIDDMAAAYTWADLALCRAGASTVAELCAAGVPSVLVPFPYAIHDHQMKNAAVLERCGAARLFREDALAGQMVVDALIELMAQPRMRAAMSKAALSASLRDAAGRVVDVLEDICGNA